MSEGLIQQAVQTARAGQRKEARELLMQVVEENEESEMAWYYLGALLEDADDRMLALENALYLNPHNAKTRLYLNKLRMQEAVKAIKANDREHGRNLLLKIVESDEENEEAWLWLSRASKDMANKIVALENVVTLNPHNKEAGQQLEHYKHLHTDPMALAAFYEKQGDFNQARRIYQNAMGFHNPVSMQQKAKDYMRKLDWHLDSSDEPIDLTRVIVRYVVGSMLLYLLLIFIQAGMNPFYISLPLAVGSLGVLFGSLLIVGVVSVPHHPLWTQLFGVHGLQPYTRALFATLGFVLTLVPYALLFLIAYQRLLAYPS